MLRTASGCSRKVSGHNCSRICDLPPSAPTRMVPDSAVPSSKCAVTPSAVSSNLTSFLFHFTPQTSDYGEPGYKRGFVSTAYLDRQILHQQLPEALPLEPQSSTRRDLLIDFSGLHIQEQEVALIHFTLFGVNLGFQKPFAELTRKTVFQCRECPVEGYGPSLAAGPSMRIALEDGKTDTILYPN